MQYELPELWVEDDRNELERVYDETEIRYDASLFDDREDWPDDYNLEGEFDIDSFDW